MKEVVECLKEWLNTFRNSENPWVASLVERSDDAIEALDKSNHSRTAKAAEKAGRNRIPLARKLKIARDSKKTTVAKAAEKYGVATSTVVECRKLLDSMPKS